ncbi:MAG: DUF2269 family protein [Kineosporiaceae bacterium]|nr:DUF2269 family protein [Aeromicrobium sp.]
METLFNLLHVVTGVFIIGPMAILPMTGMRAIRAGQAGQVTSLAKSVNVFNLLSLVVVILGFGALEISHISLASTWVWLSLVFYFVALALNMLIVVPALRTAAEALTADATGDAASAHVTGTKVPGYSRVAMMSGIVALLLVLIVVLMVLKP